MLYYEMKKVLSRRGSRITMLLLLAMVVLVSYIAIAGVTWVDEKGITHGGPAAIQKLQQAQKEWEGPLSEERIAEVIAENARILATPEAKSSDIAGQELAYSWKQGFSDIRDLINCSYCDFREYDYYRIDSLRPDMAAAFYENREGNLAAWLDGEAKDQYSEEEKQFFLTSYRELPVPLSYTYHRGWTQMTEFATTVQMLFLLLISFIVGGIFPCESGWKADAIFFTSYHGRKRAVASKVKAGLCIVSAGYWCAMLVYTAAVLGFLGWEGGGSLIQSDRSGWKSFYHITFQEQYMLVLFGGYIGCLFMTAVSMLVAAKTRSAALAVTIPFFLLFAPSFMGIAGGPIVAKILGLLPDQLLQLGVVTNYFNVYRMGGRIVGVIGILLVLYSVCTLLLQPVIYMVYRRTQVQ